MTVWIFPSVLILIGVLAIALFRHRNGAAEIYKCIRKAAVYILSFLIVCFASVAILLTTFSYSSDFLNSVLSAEFIADMRLVLKALFGSESVFTSLQMLGALSLFLFSFASCAFYICGVYFILTSNVFDKGKCIDDYPKEVTDVPDRICVRRFALLSRYLL